MIGNICMLLEEFSVLLCIHYLYGEKFRFDIKTTSYLTIYMIIMVVINYYEFPKVCTIVTYPLIFLYCGIKFGFRLKELIINNILFMAIVGGVQLAIAIGYSWIFNMLSFDILKFRNSELLTINIGVLLIVVGILSRIKIHKLSIYLQDKERILVIFLFFCVGVTLISFANFKMTNGFNFYQSLGFFVGVVLFCIFAGQLGKYKIKAKEIETELKMYILFSDSFRNLIEDIRSRQHEFDNHINTIYSLHYTCNSYDKLVKAQKEYSQAVIKENRYNKLLKAENPLLIGFLYGKFIEIEKLGINITYQIDIGDLNINIPVYKLVEILGNLIKNAVDAIKDIKKEKALHVAVIESDAALNIEVRNKSVFIDYVEIEKFFSRGYSKKGIDRGLGLYNVKKICDDFSLNIVCENKLIDEENWISFSVNNEKGAI